MFQFLGSHRHFQDGTSSIDKHTQFAYTHLHTNSSTAALPGTYLHFLLLWAHTQTLPSAHTCANTSKHAHIHKCKEQHSFSITGASAITTAMLVGTATGKQKRNSSFGTWICGSQESEREPQK